MATSGFFEQLTSPAGVQVRSLYTAALANALRYRQQVPDPSYAVLKESNVYELARRDPELASMVQARKHAVAGTEWAIVPAKKVKTGVPAELGAPGTDPTKAVREVDPDALVASMVQELIERIDNFDGARLNLCEATFTGSSYAKIIGRRRWTTLSDGVQRAYWVPERIIDIDRRRVRIKCDRSEPKKPRWFLEICDVYDGAVWREVTPQMRKWLVEHVYDDAEVALGYGRGLFDSIYHFWYFKTVAMTEGLQGLERWAQGWVTLAIDPDRAASTGRENDLVVQEAIDTVAKHRSRHVLAYMKGDELDVKQGGGEGHQIVMDFIRYCDDGMRRLINGSLIPTGGGDPGYGSGERADAEQASSDTLYHFDRRNLESSLTKSLVALTYELNRGIFDSMGLYGAGRPRFSLAPEERIDTKAEVDKIKTLIDCGVDLKLEEVYEKTGYTKPGPLDEKLEGRLAPDPAASFGAFGAGFPGGPPSGPGAAKEEKLEEAAA